MRHKFPCSNPDCGFCETQAEARGWDPEPDYDESAAADQHERSVGL